MPPIESPPTYPPSHTIPYLCISSFLQPLKLNFTILKSQVYALLHTPSLHPPMFFTFIAHVKMNIISNYYYWNKSEQEYLSSQFICPQDWIFYKMKGGNFEGLMMKPINEKSSRAETNYNLNTSTNGKVKFQNKWRVRVFCKLFKETTSSATQVG